MAVLLYKQMRPPPDTDHVLIDHSVSLSNLETMQYD